LIATFRPSRNAIPVVFNQLVFGYKRVNHKRGPSPWRNYEMELLTKAEVGGIDGGETNCCGFLAGVVYAAGLPCAYTPDPRVCAAPPIEHGMVFPTS